MEHYLGFPSTDRLGSHWTEGVLVIVPVQLVPFKKIVLEVKKI